MDEKSNGFGLKRESCTKKYLISDDFGLKSRPVIHKPFQTNSATSIVACGGCGPVSQCERIPIIHLQKKGDGVSYFFKKIVLLNSLPTTFWHWFAQVGMQFSICPFVLQLL